MSQGNQGGQICKGKGYGPMPSQGVAIADCKVCREVTDIPGGHRVRAELRGGRTKRGEVVEGPQTSGRA